VLAEADRGLRLLSVDREGRISNVTPDTD
jgi:hypothetical protein